MRSPYRPLPSCVVVGLTARPSVTAWGCGGWGCLAPGTHQEPGGWGGQLPPHPKGRAHSPETSQPPILYPRFARMIYMQAGTHPAPGVLRCFIQTLYPSLVILFCFTFLYSLEGLITEVLLSISTNGGLYSRLKHGKLIMKGGDAHEPRNSSASKVLVFGMSLLHLARDSKRWDTILSLMQNTLTLGAIIMARYQFTKADRQKGFRNAVLSVHTKYNLDFNEAVQWMLRKINPGGDWVSYRKGIYWDKP